MNKKTKLVLGVAAIGAVAYYLWNKSKTTKAYANQMGNYSQGLYNPSSQSCYGHNISCPDGKTYCIGFDQEYKCPTNSTKSAIVSVKPIQVAKSSKY
jgi:hypothetical protein